MSTVICPHDDPLHGNCPWCKTGRYALPQHPTGDSREAYEKAILAIYGELRDAGITVGCPIPLRDEVFGEAHQNELTYLVIRCRAAIRECGQWNLARHAT